MNRISLSATPPVAPHKYNENEPAELSVENYKLHKSEIGSEAPGTIFLLAYALCNQYRPECHHLKTGNCLTTNFIEEIFDID